MVLADQININFINLENILPNCEDILNNAQQYNIF